MVDLETLKGLFRKCVECVRSPVLNQILSDKEGLPITLENLGAWIWTVRTKMRRRKYNYSVLKSGIGNY